MPVYVDYQHTNGKGRGGGGGAVSWDCGGYRQGGDGAVAGSGVAYVTGLTSGGTVTVTVGAGGNAGGSSGANVTQPTAGSAGIVWIEW